MPARRRSLGRCTRHQSIIPRGLLVLLRHRIEAAGRPTKYGSVEMGATTMIGAGIRRIEDPRLLRGKGSYVDDISLPGILHAALVRSPYGHARIKRIDLAAVKAASGVVDAFTLTDGWEEPPTIPVLVGVPSLLPCYQYPLARDKVRYVGEPVAVVVAIDRAHADEAAELAKVEYEPLPVIADCEAAQTASA